MSIITIQEVTTEFVKKPKGGYSVANVTYTDNGKNFTKKIMSFANPAVFDVVKDAKQGDILDVTVTKDGEYYNWSSAKKVDKDTTERPQAAPASGRVLGSNYETADERKLKQLYIIKQSSIANALMYLGFNEGVQDHSVNEVLAVAQQFVDFVYGVEENLGTVDSEN